MSFGMSIAGTRSLAGGCGCRSRSILSSVSVRRSSVLASRSASVDAEGPLPIIARIRSTALSCPLTERSNASASAVLSSPSSGSLASACSTSACSFSSGGRPRGARSLRSGQPSLMASRSIVLRVVLYSAAIESCVSSVST